MGRYDVSQICLNGHTITRSANRYPEFRQKFCKECGDATCMECQKCKTPIQGEYHIEGFVGVERTPPPPAFCHECGSAYPWTARRIEAAKELADELEGLSDEERQTLKKSLDDLIRDTPRTELAGTRFKKVMKKVSKESYETMKSIVTDVVSETVKKTIFGQ